MWACDSGEIEANSTERGCRIIHDTINPPYFVSSSQFFDKYIGYILFGGWGLQIVVNKGRTFKTFRKYISSGKAKNTSTLFNRYYLIDIVLDI